MLAITRNGRALCWVALLLLIIIYVYTLIAFAVFRQYFDEGEGAFCVNMGQCFVTSVRLGLLAGGGLGDALPLNTVPTYSSFSEPGKRTAFDLTFFLLVTIIGLNVVFGIIVDTFSELRAEQSETQAKMVSACFICGLESHDFERHGHGFQHHVQKEHRMWDYLFFCTFRGSVRTAGTAQ